MLMFVIKTWIHYQLKATVYCIATSRLSVFERVPLSACVQFARHSFICVVSAIGWCIGRRSSPIFLPFFFLAHAKNVNKNSSKYRLFSHLCHLLPSPVCVRARECIFFCQISIFHILQANKQQDKSRGFCFFFLFQIPEYRLKKHFTFLWTKRKWTKKNVCFVVVDPIHAFAC